VAWQKCFRPHAKQKAIRHCEHQPKESGRGSPQTAQVIASV
jgi:hypothetical protein